MVFILAAVAAAALTVDELRVRALKMDIRHAEIDLKACQDANKANQHTIQELKRERQASIAGYEARMQTKDAAVRRLQEIDRLKGGKNEKTAALLGTDPLLDELNRMWRDNSSGSKDGVHQDSDPRSAPGSALLSRRLAM
jgi:hypothetical protein